MPPIKTELLNITYALPGWIVAFQHGDKIETAPIACWALVEVTYENEEVYRYIDGTFGMHLDLAMDCTNFFGFFSSEKEARAAWKDELKERPIRKKQIEETYRKMGYNSPDEFFSQRNNISANYPGGNSPTLSH